VLKALEKDRTRRYGSPSDLAADIERYLRNEPVQAVRPSAVYQARKFAWRYRVALATAAAFVLVLILAAGISVRQSVRANSEAAVAQAVNEFLRNDLLARASAAHQAGLNSKPDPHLEVRTALDRAAARIDGKFDQQPEVEAAIRDTIGETYIDLGVFREARKQLEQALELHRRLQGEENPKVFKAKSSLGRVAYLQGNYAEASALISAALDGQRRVLGSENRDTLASERLPGRSLSEQGKYADAEVLDRETLDLQRRLLGPEHPDTVSSIDSLAIVYIEEGKYAQAEPRRSITRPLKSGDAC
jgi:tetratricopeptide (TPR) repeat protein